PIARRGCRPAPTRRTRVSAPRWPCRVFGPATALATRRGHWYKASFKNSSWLGTMSSRGSGCGHLLPTTPALGPHGCESFLITIPKGLHRGADYCGSGGDDSQVVLTQRSCSAHLACLRR